MDLAPPYPKGDLRRMLVVLGAIDELDVATLVRIAERIGLDKKTIINLFIVHGYWRARNGIE